MIPPDSDDLDEFGLGYEGRGAPVSSPAPAAREEEIGESLRGLQDEQAAQGVLAKLRGKLGAFAKQRIDQHEPVAKNLRSPYRDNTQIGIVCSGTFTPSDWAGGKLPQISGVQRIYQAFKPQKAILSETLIVVFTSQGKTETVAVSVDDASDLVLTQMHNCNANMFPNAAPGISGRTFSHSSPGGGISYPTMQAHTDLTAQFTIEESMLYRAVPPVGFTTADITSIKVTAHFALIGPTLR